MGKRVILTYYQMKCGSFRVMRTDKVGEFFTYEKLPDSIKHKFFMFKGYSPNDDGLSDFTADFKIWNHELKKTTFII